MTEHLPALADRFELRLTMLSDWHVGSGLGRPGHVDRLIARDADHLPYVPAKTLTGICRDACERLAYGLDGGNEGRWSQWVTFLFGDQPSRPGETDPTVHPRPAAIAIRPARLPKTLRQKLSGQSPQQRALRDALTFIKPGVKIDSRSGRALDRHLRFEEMARAGTVLEAECRVAWPAEPTQRAAAQALLVAATCLVDRLGGKRRRGAGRCRLECLGADADSAVAWLASNDPPPEPPAGCSASASTSGTPLAPQVPPSDAWFSVPFVLELSEPLAVSARTVGNVMESLDFLPGTFLLPHLTQAFLHAGLDIRPAIARGDLRVLPACVEVNGQPGRPIPLACYARKDSEPFAETDGSRNGLLDELPSDGPPFKQCRQGYVGASRNGVLPQYATVPREPRTHNTIAEEEQRPTSAVGGVYTYEAIAAPRLCGEVRMRAYLFDALQRHSDWRKCLEGPCRLGSSKKDDYGAATLELVGGPEPTALAEPPASDQLVVWALSDILLCDQRLRPTPTLEGLKCELERQLGLELIADPKATFLRVRRIESWQVAWGLPRPSLVGIQAGSCASFHFAHSQRPDQNTLSRIEAQGIGQRTAEGYGHIRFNDPLLLTSLKGCSAPSRPEVQGDGSGRGTSLPTAAFAGPDLEFAQRIEQEAWREAIRRAALTVAEDARRWLGWTAEKPPSSQLGNLRSAVIQVRSWTDAASVQKWLKDVEAKRGKKWNGGLKEVNHLFTDRKAVWERLRTGLDKDTPPVDRPTLTPDSAERLEGELWDFAVRALLDACIRAEKRRRDSEPIQKTVS